MSPTYASQLLVIDLNGPLVENNMTLLAPKLDPKELLSIMTPLPNKIY